MHIVFFEYINNLSELCKDAPRLFFSTTNENKRKLLKLVCPNPKVIGSKVILEPIPVFENIKNIQKLKKLETRGVSWSLACNGNSAICGGFSTLTNRLQPQLAPARIPDKTSSCRGSQLHNLSNKKGLL